MISKPFRQSELLARLQHLLGAVDHVGSGACRSSMLPLRCIEPAVSLGFHRTLVVNVATNPIEQVPVIRKIKAAPRKRPCIVYATIGVCSCFFVSSAGRGSAGSCRTVAL